MSEPPRWSAQSTTLVAKTAWSAAATAATTLGSVIAGIAIYRLLSPAHAGAVAYGAWFATVAAGLLGAGLPASVTRYVAELGSTRSPEAALALGRWCVRVGLTLTAVATPVVVGLWSLSGGGAPAGSAEVAALFVAQSASALASALLIGLERYRRLATLNAVSSALAVAAPACGALLWGVRGALAGYALAALPLALAAGAFGATRDAQRPEPGLGARLGSYAAASWIATVVAAIVWSRAELFFLQRFAGPAAVAMFGVGVSLAQLAAQAPLLLAGALVPHFTQQAASAHRAVLAVTYASAARVLALTVLPLCLWAAAMAPTLVPALFGPAYAPAADAAAILLAGAPIGVIASAASGVVSALERSRFITLSGIASAAAAAIVYALAIPRFGVIGAAWSRLILQFAASLAGYTYLWFALRIPSPFGTFGKVLAAAGGSAALAGGIVRAWPGTAALLPAILAAALSYFPLLRVLGAIPQSEAAKLLDAVEQFPSFLRGLGRLIVRLAVR